MHSRKTIQNGKRKIRTNTRTEERRRETKFVQFVLLPRKEKKRKKRDDEDNTLMVKQNLQEFVS